MPLALLSEALGMEAGALIIVLEMFSGLRGVRLVDRPGVVPVVFLPRVAASRLGLALVRGRWAIAPDEGAEGPRHDPGGSRVRLEASPETVADPRQRTPLEILARREEEELEPGEERPPDRIGNLGRWLAEWERTGERPSPPPPKGEPSRRKPAPPLARNSFDLGELRRRLEAAAASSPPGPLVHPAATSWEWL